MSLPTRSTLFLGVLMLCCLTPLRAHAQVRVPDSGHLGLAIEEPTSTLSTTTDSATRLWQRILAWSTRRTSDQRWRALYSRPSTAPAATTAKASQR